MPHIALNSAEPGIRGLLRYRPQTARPLSELTEVLLRGPSPGGAITCSQGASGLGDRRVVAGCAGNLAACRFPDGGFMPGCPVALLVRARC